MDAVRVDWDDKQSTALCHHVKWELLGADGHVLVKVNAPSARCFMDRDVVEFAGPVVARRPALGDVLRVNHLVWKGHVRRFYGSRGVRWTRGRSLLRGRSLVATATLDKVWLQGQVSGRTYWRTNR